MMLMKLPFTTMQNKKLFKTKKRKTIRLNFLINPEACTLHYSSTTTVLPKIMHFFSNTKKKDSAL
jgi:hypothetical protein